MMIMIKMMLLLAVAMHTSLSLTEVRKVIIIPEETEYFNIVPLCCVVRWKSSPHYIQYFLSNIVFIRFRTKR